MTNSTAKADAFGNMMCAYDSAAALLDMMGEMEGVVIEGRHVTLFNRTFNDMMTAKREWEEAQTE